MRWNIFPPLRSLRSLWFIPLILLRIGCIPAQAQTTNVNISISGPIALTNTTDVLWILTTTQLADNELTIQQSAQLDFSMPVEAIWSCYPVEQPVGGFFINPPGGSHFYRSINNPCAATFAPAAMRIDPSPQLAPQLKAWRNKDGLRLGPEILSDTTNAHRRFLLVR